jgi:hypothetical protein
VIKSIHHLHELGGALALWYMTKKITLIMPGWMQIEEHYPRFLVCKARTVNVFNACASVFGQYAGVIRTHQ